MGRQHAGRGRTRPPASAIGRADNAGQRNELRLGNLEWTSPASPERIARRRRHRYFRQVRRALGAGMAFTLLGAIVFAALLLVTPSVGSAPRLVRNLERAHNSPLTGRVSPMRFSAVMKAVQERARDTNGSMSGVTEFVGQFLGPTRRNFAVDQQLASMLYLGSGKGEMAQIEQAVLVMKLRWTYSENRLIDMFAAVASFGHGYYGLASASCGYFGQRPGHLSWGQMAMLAAIAMNPATDDPYAESARAKRDQAAVLRSMVLAGTFGNDQAARLGREPLHLRGLLATSRAADSASRTCASRPPSR
jgi:transglycosylase-like protein